MKIKRINFVLILLAFVLALALACKYQTEPKEFVLNQTFVKQSDLFFTYEITKYPSNVEVILPQYREEKLTIGLVTDPWNLNFGIIPAGGYGARTLTVSNFEEKKVKVILKAYGDIKPMVSFSNNNFILMPNDSTSIKIFLNTTRTTKPNNYTGEIDVIVKKPNFEFLYLLL